MAINQMETQSSKNRDLFLALLVVCALYLTGLGVTVYLADTQLYKIFSVHTINDLKILLPWAIAWFIICFAVLLIPGLLSDGMRRFVYIGSAISILLLGSYIVLAESGPPSFSCF